MLYLFNKRNIYYIPAVLSCLILMISVAFANTEVHDHGLAILVPQEDATHVAVKNGSWFSTSTWQGGVIPGNNARVVISSGIDVVYDQQSNSRLFTVRVDGTLRFSTTQNSRMVVDTFIVNTSGALVIGTAADPVRPSVNVEIVIADNGNINVGWDKQLITRGLISQGDIAIHGAKKVSHLKVAIDPQIGDTSITLAKSPLGWQVGDTIVIAGTFYKGYAWDNNIQETRHYLPEDEVRTITAINEERVSFAEPLVHKHGSPRGDLKTSVANYTRNITVRSENGASSAVHHRGHVMFMNNKVDIRYAAFHELGRTDKSKPARQPEEFSPIAPNSNAKGRYSFHFHRTGVLSHLGNPGMSVGNAVFGSPSWGFVHHDSHAIFHDNASYNTFGAGFVAETGNEIGSWTHNIAIYAKGIKWGNPKNAVDLDNFDTANGGDGFWFQGRMVDSTGNIAASTNNGFAYFHRSPEINGVIKFDARIFELPEALGLRTSVHPDDSPILHFRGNETFGSRCGLFVVKANPNQGHDVRTILDDFTAWNILEGAHLEYTSHYTLKNFDLVGRQDSKVGVVFGKNTSDMTVVDTRIVGFKEAGVDLFKETTFPFSPDRHKYALIGVEIIGSDKKYLNYNPEYDVVIASSNEVKALSVPQITLASNLIHLSGGNVSVNGTKVDSIGSISLPAGSDTYNAKDDEVVKILETSGYFKGLDGKNYFVLEDYYSDRFTGEIHKWGGLVEINANVPLGNPFKQYKNAQFKGLINPSNKPPITDSITATSGRNSLVEISLLQKASDPEGDVVYVDGITQPRYGDILDNGDGTVIYRPDIDFSGVDTFTFWLTNGYGKFTRAHAFIQVDSTETPVIDTPNSGGSDGDNNDGTTGELCTDISSLVSKFKLSSFTTGDALFMSLHEELKAIMKRILQGLRNDDFEVMKSKKNKLIKAAKLIEKSIRSTKKLSSKKLKKLGENRLPSLAKRLSCS
jgi:G8 domain/Bacterial Ig domain